MQVIKLTRSLVQLAAFILFAFQMVQALLKFFSFNTFPSVETKDTVDARLPYIFICLQAILWIRTIETI